ncbi:hypothetical protein [Paraglaciecola sp. 2405UD69-4]|uniref:hypothetical protein n=1 Tax=Paraglaciecola sp. 2405UD69-4 TaxID=3391836 RepID=UPI0039C9960D
MVNIENTSTIISTVILLILFMYFGVNLAMIVLERKISASSIQSLGSELAKMINETDNPDSYKQARIYLVGSVLSLLAFFALLEFGYA